MYGGFLIPVPHGFSMENAVVWEDHGKKVFTLCL